MLRDIADPEKSYDTFHDAMQQWFESSIIRVDGWRIGRGGEVFDVKSERSKLPRDYIPCHSIMGLWVRSKKSFLKQKKAVRAIFGIYQLF